MGDCVLIWDCGATNIRAVVVDVEGRLLAESKSSNSSVGQDEKHPDWLIWDVDRIFDTLCGLSAEVVGKVGKDRVDGIIVTTWGADATCVDESGSMLYPLISWQCSRTKDTAEKIKSLVEPIEIFRRTGYQVIPFNTFVKLLWIKENEPDVWKKTKKILTITGLLNHRLTGRLTIDPTMAGTSMGFNVVDRDWDDKMLSVLGAGKEIFPDMVEPGEVIGEVLPDVADRIGLSSDVRVISGGHDTQFAIYGSGFREGEAVLSSGTWEILMIKVPAFEPNEEMFASGIIVEQDAVKGFADPQFLMQGSGPLEWIRKNFWGADESKGNIYDVMVGEAEDVSIGSDGIVFIPSFVSDTGPASRYKTPGSIIGLTLKCSRGQIYRAALEGLSMQLRHAIDIFSDTIGFSPRAVRVVGGGSKNRLWNKIRADVLNLPIITTEHKEATVLGSAMFAFVGLGRFSTIEEAVSNIDVGENVVSPDSRANKKYSEIYEKYLGLVEDVGKAYS